MDEPLVRITRNFYISLAIAIVILFGGGLFLFRGSETGSGVAMVLAFAVGLTLLQVLDDRDERRRQQRHDDSPR
jgi:hypothetical protein